MKTSKLKRAVTILIICFCTLNLFSSCDKLPDPKFETRGTSKWVVPIGYGDISISNILEHQNISDNLIVKDDHLYFQYTRENLVDLSIRDYINEHQFEGSFSTKIPKDGFVSTIEIESGYVEVLQELIPDTKGTLEIQLPKEIKTINKLEGDIVLDVSIKGIPADIDYVITFDNLYDKNGEKLSKIISQGTQETSIVWELHQINFPATNGNHIDVNYQIKPIVKKVPEKIVLFEGSAINFNAKVRELSINIFEGITSPIIYDFNFDLDENNGFPPFKEANGLKIENGSIRVDILSKDIAHDTESILSCDTKNGSKSHKIQKTISIESIGREESTPIIYKGKEVDLLLTDVLTYPCQIRGQMISNPNGEVIKLTRNSKLKTSVTLEQKLAIGIESVILNDTIWDLEVEGIKDLESIAKESLTLQMQSKSNIPVNIDLIEMVLLDQNEDRLPNSNIPIKGTILGGTKDEFKTSSLNIRLTNDQIKTLEETSAIALKLKMRTPNGAIVPLKNNQNIQFTLVGITNSNLE